MGSLPFPSGSELGEKPSPTVFGVFLGGSLRLFFLSSLVSILLLVLIFVFPLEQQLVPKLPEYDVNKPEVANQRLQQLGVLEPESRANIIKSFIERDLPKAATAPASDEFRKSEPYRNLYSTLWARYNASKDPATLAEMKKIEQFIAQNWSTLYQVLSQSGGFLK